ncbi:helix-loop-helix DNA-binding domain-containing protein [Colletotrichum orchidophilum]|uniref:Helix-loop-helix DNA-binding domain-containing protein n=1 Tax=Colletotrichum orchidophilum TaxID=1209926 RepID=A0A1G4BFN4_9PEZI|nr:helix-loop-helix DNA-binding domain-containing protein [Colletotrichum orchidophilum]OHF00113.1 helix-loop-helix DNA-binding domain-containing protein [Colletotrichum orchidophilum]
MAHTPNENTPFYEYLVDDPEVSISPGVAFHFSVRCPSPRSAALQWLAFLAVESRIQRPAHSAQCLVTTFSICRPGRHMNVTRQALDQAIEGASEYMMPLGSTKPSQIPPPLKDLPDEKSNHDPMTVQNFLHYFVCRWSPPMLEKREKKSDHCFFYQQMIASTPLSPHFSPEVFGGAFDVGDRQHHATRPGNQTTLLSPGHNRPNTVNESTTATPLNQAQAIAGVPELSVPTAQFPQVHGLGGLHHLDRQHQQNHTQQQLLQPQLHPSTLGLGLGLGTLGLTHAEGRQGLQHQFGPAAAPAPNIADQQGTLSPQLHLQGHQRVPAAWLPPGYGIPVYHDNPQQHVDATSSSTSAAGVNPSVTLSAAGSLSTDGNSQSIGVGGGHLFDFGFAAPPPPPSEQPFLGGGVYADITPLSTTLAVTAHPQPPTTTFDFHASPWRPRLQDSSSVTLTPNIAAVAAVELNHDVRKHSKSSMETDSDVKDPSWDDDENEPQDKRGGAGAKQTSSSSSPGNRKPQRKGKRRAVADPGAGGIDDDDEPTSPAGRTSVSGRSVKSASVASSAGSSTKTAPAPRLRSASRTSKNALQKPTESLEERRTRASHNLVEKQYRNRLNAQFEGLLNALPEQVRGPAGTGDGDESDPQAAAAAANEERRVSKAEVLDMARRHIQNLERERETLHRERGELLRNLETLEREAAVNGGSGGRLDEFLDVEGASDERGASSAWRNA